MSAVRKLTPVETPANDDTETLELADADRLEDAIAEAAVAEDVEPAWRPALDEDVYVKGFAVRMRVTELIGITEARCVWFVHGHLHMADLPVTILSPRPDGWPHDTLRYAVDDLGEIFVPFTDGTLKHVTGKAIRDELIEKLTTPIA